MKRADTEALLHDLHSPFAKIKTALALMEDASPEEIQAEFLPLLQLSVEEFEEAYRRLSALLKME